MIAYSAHTDEQLLNLLKTDDEWAFTEIYHRYWQQIYTVDYHFSGLEAAAELCVQQVFKSLWDSRQALNISHCIVGYLATAVKYHVIHQKLGGNNKELMLSTVSQVQKASSINQEINEQILQEYLNRVNDHLIDNNVFVHPFENKNTSFDTIAAPIGKGALLKVKSPFVRAFHAIRLSIFQLKLK